MLSIGDLSRRGRIGTPVRREYERLSLVDTLGRRDDPDWSSRARYLVSTQSFREGMLREMNIVSIHVLETMSASH